MDGSICYVLVHREQMKLVLRHLRHIFTYHDTIVKRQLQAKRSVEVCIMLLYLLSVISTMEKFWPNIGSRWRNAVANSSITQSTRNEYKRDVVHAQQFNFAFVEYVVQHWLALRGQMLLCKDIRVHNGSTRVITAKCLLSVQATNVLPRQEVEEQSHYSLACRTAFLTLQQHVAPLLC